MRDTIHLPNVASSCAGAAVENSARQRTSGDIEDARERALIYLTCVSDEALVEHLASRGWHVLIARSAADAARLTRPDVPKYASNDRLMGTAEENTAAAQGVLAFFGTYTVNEADRVIALHVDGSSYPNINGADRKFAITKLTGDELDYSILTPTADAATYVVLKRAK